MKLALVVFGYSVHLKKKGVNCKVIHPADVPTSHKEHLRKTDAVDSRKIAKGLRNGDLNYIHVPELNLELDRQLLRSRVILTKDSTRIKNRIKAMLKLHGISIPAIYAEGAWSQAFMKWINQIDFAHISGTITLQNLLSQYIFFSGKEKAGGCSH